MYCWLLGFAGFMLGGTLAALLMAILSMAKSRDEQENT
jgi:predicted PurR-regulated permease PerM